MLSEMTLERGIQRESRGAMLTRDDRSHFAEPCLSNARHRHRIWVRVYGGACDGMDGPAAQQPGGTPLPSNGSMAAWQQDQLISQRNARP